MNVFEAVKNTVTTRQAAEYYGIKVTKNGMACCPFHRDRHPSMKLDQRLLVPGRRKGSDQLGAGQRHLYSGGCEALAWGKERFLVQPYCI